MSDREDFEEAAVRMGYSLRMRDPASEDGEYGDRKTQCAWDMWQECCDKSARAQQAGSGEADFRAEIRTERDPSDEYVSFLTLVSEGKSSPYMYIPEALDQDVLDEALRRLNTHPSASVPDSAERVLASLGHYQTESARCRARYKEVATNTQGPKNPPVFCILPNGHDGPHRSQRGSKMRNSLIEFGPAITVCAKCKVRWPCPDAEKAFKASATPHPAPSAPALDDEVRWILGRPNFACIGIAQYLRAQGRDIPSKAECEQAEVIHWMLGLYAQHGAGWRRKAAELLSQANPPAEGAE